MEWRDRGIILGTRKHGEAALIVDLLTAEHGRVCSVLRGGTSRKMRPVVQPANLVDVSYHARLETHLGAIKLEPLKSRTPYFSDRLLLAGIGAVTALVAGALGEQDPQPVIFEKTEGLFSLLDTGALWPVAYLRWEMMLLAELGFALDLSSCAVTGAREELCYISPKTGRAVSKDGAGEWADRMLPLPRALVDNCDDVQEILKGFSVTGYFLKRLVFPEDTQEKYLAPRAHFVETYERLGQSEKNF